MTINKLDKQSTTTWLEDGIIYSEIRDELSLKNLLEAEEAALKIVKEHNLSHVPTIVIMSENLNDKVVLGVSEFGKAISSNQIVKHLTSVAIVGAGEHMKRVGGMFNKLFFSNRIHFFDNLQEAQVFSREALSNALPILEQP